MSSYDTEIIYPQFYTSAEAGQWLGCKGLETTRRKLNKLRQDRGKDRVVKIEYVKKRYHLTVHSLAFEDPTALYIDEYARWDVVNGWTKKIKRKAKRA